MSDPRWALMAEYETAEALVAAAQAAHDAGFRAIEAYAPFHVEGLSEAVGFRRSRLPAVVLACAIAGGIGGYALQWFAATRSYPIEVGARPLNSWPMFVPVTFETTILAGAFAAFLGALVANGLPRLAHPIFDAPDFDLATRNRFFLCLRTDDPRFDDARAAALLDSTRPLRRAEVAR